jgi:tetratricopeptide (TPR) repeat protein
VGDRRAAISQFNLAAPAADAAKAGGDWQLPYQLYSSACMNDDTMGMAWFQLGDSLSDMQHSAAALASFRRAVELPDGTTPGDIDPSYRAKALVQIAYRLYVLGRIDEADETIGQAMELDCAIPQVWCVRSLISSIKGDHGEAVFAARHGLSLDPDNATIETALGINLLFKGDLAEGLKHFEARFRYKLKHFLNFPYPQWHGEAGKTVFLVADQGLGDTLSFARFLSAAAKRSKFVYVGAQKELVRLFKASFQHIPNIEIVPPMATGWPPADAWTTFVSLPTALGLSDDEIKNAKGVAIPQFTVPLSWRSPDKKFHVAVAWRGSKLSDIDHHRSFGIENFLRLYEVPGIQLYSIQADASAAELHSAGCAALIRDLSPFISDVSDTTGILRHIDLVITVESAPGHIAGACGKETWIPYSFLGSDYRLGRQGENIIWYPKHRVFKQGSRDTWGDVFGRIVDALRERIDA